MFKLCFSCRFYLNLDVHEYNDDRKIHFMDMKIIDNQINHHDGF